MKNHFLLVFPATKKHSCGVIFIYLFIFCVESFLKDLFLS